MKNDTWKSYNPLAVGYRAVMSNVRILKASIIIIVTIIKFILIITFSFM